MARADNFLISKAVILFCDFICSQSDLWQGKQPFWYKCQKPYNTYVKMLYASKQRLRVRKKGSAEGEQSSQMGAQHLWFVTVPWARDWPWMQIKNIYWATVQNV